VFNEFHQITAAQLTQVYQTIIPIMRELNPARRIYLGGLQYMNP
jgi:hypothetical protein